MKSLILILAGALSCLSPLCAAELKLEDVVVEDGDNQAKTFHIPISKISDAPVSLKDVVLKVYCYEVKDGVVAVGEPLSYKWMSEPIDWKDSDTEDARVDYAGPTGTGKSYIGFIAALYYQNELQNSWASAPELLKEFPVSARLGQ